MKKLFLMMGLACLFMVACNNAPKTVTPEQLLSEYANWDRLNQQQKDALNTKSLDFFADFHGEKPEEWRESFKAVETEDLKVMCVGKLNDMLNPTAEEHHCPFCPLKAEYANWDNMDETAKAELNKRAYDLFAQMDAEMEAKRAECEAKGEGKPCCKEGEGEHKCAHEGEGHQCNHEGEGHQCNHDGEHKCAHEMAEMTEEQKAECEAKCAEMKAAWESFESLSLDEQKDLILGRIAAMGMGGDKCEHEAEAHQCQHEGEGHQCDQPK